MKHIFSFLALSLLLMTPTAQAQNPASKNKPIVCYVSPTGKDSNAGTKSRPFATLQFAWNWMKQRAAPAPASCTIRVRGGVYELAEPLRFDDWTSATPLVIEAEKNELPIISGGERLTGWKERAPGRWEVTLPQVAKGERNFQQLYFDDERRMRPRAPQSGYFHIEREVEASPKFKDKGFDRIGFRAGDVRSDWANRGDIEVLGFQIWTMTRQHIADIDAAQRNITFGGRTRGAGWSNRLALGQRYLIENVKENLTQPGQWYLDRPSGVLTYLAQPGENPNRSRVVAPRLTSLLHINNVRDVSLRGLQFSHSAWELAPTGYAERQAEIQIPAAIQVTKSLRVAIENCRVQNVGTAGIALGDGARYCRIEKSVLRDLGAGGVRIGTETYQADESQIAAYNVVRDCLIAQGGRVHPSAVGVWVGQSPYTRVEWNDIYDWYYSGISCGWTWGYAPNNTHHITLSHNRIHKIGQGVMSDMGGIYHLGIGTGTEISYNVIHDVDAFDYGGWGIYTDEGSSDVSIHHNVVYRCNTSPFDQHFGVRNKVENNVFAMGGDALMMRTRSDNNDEATPVLKDELSFMIQRNIIFWQDDTVLLGADWTGTNFVLKNNLYWNTRFGKNLRFPGDQTLAQWQKTSQHDEGSLVADPLFVNAAQDDFGLRPDSPARQVGFVPFEIAAGPRGKDPKLNRQNLPPDATFPPVPPRGALTFDWPNQTIGQRPIGPRKMNLRIDTEKPEVTDIRVVETPETQSKRSLHFTENGTAEWADWPALSYDTRVAKGVADSQFAVKLGAGSVFRHLWNGTGGQIGANIVFDEGVLSAGERELGRFPLQQWLRVHVIAPMGAGANGTYRVEVQTPDGKKQVFTELPFQNKEFNQIRSWQFMSDGKRPGEFWLSDMKLGGKFWR